jgi:hypothetical protein
VHKNTWTIHQRYLSLKSETKQGKKVEGGCSHCHNPKHIKDTCFKLHRYPDWWCDLNEKKVARNKKEQGGQAHLVGHTDRIEDSTYQASLTLATHVKGINRTAEKGNALVAQNLEKWIIDSGATDHMTYLESDLDMIGKSNRKEIMNANEVSSQVMRSRIVNVTGSLCLKDTILIDHKAYISW